MRARIGGLFLLASLGVGCAPSLSVPMPRPLSRIPAEVEARFEPRSAGEVSGVVEGDLGTVPAVLGGVGLQDVLGSVDRFFPELLAARQELNLAEGALLASLGGFDTSIQGTGKNKTGYYDNRVLDVRLEQPLAEFGARVFAGYRTGRGDFPSYDGDLVTNDGGELRAGAAFPILRGFTIDERRAAVWKAHIQRHAADPRVQEKRIEIVRKGSLAYWKWVASGRKVAVAQRVLQLAKDRQSSLEQAVALGTFAEIILTDNQRVIAEREGSLLGAVRAFEQAALLLSLYYRDARGEPVVLTLDDLPAAFPEVPAFDPGEVLEHIRLGLELRPELVLLRYEKAAAALDLELNENRLLPKLDAELYGSQDLGASASSSGDKDPFEFEAWIKLEVPLQRRKARGDIISSRAKIAKIEHGERFQLDQVTAEVRDAASALQRARERRDVARRGVRLAREVEEAERDALNLGVGDLLRLNLREVATASADSSLIDLEAACFAALADYRAALGLPSLGEEPPDRESDAP